MDFFQEVIIRFCLLMQVEVALGNAEGVGGVSDEWWIPGIDTSPDADGD